MTFEKARFWTYDLIFPNMQPKLFRRGLFIAELLHFKLMSATLF